jgi:uncharacterized protein (TIGR03435 family)
MVLGRIASASLATLISVAFISFALGQTFEVASVRPSGPGPGGVYDDVLRGGPGTADPVRITDSRVTLQRLIREAYGLPFDQIQGPAWMAEEKYNIIAKVPPGATKDDLKVMLQHLLEERFKLALHHVTKDFPVYELTIAKGGAKLKENTDPSLGPSRPGDPMMPLDRDGFPQLPPGKSGSTTRLVNGLNHMTTRGMPLSTLLFQLGTQLGTITGPNTYAPGRIVDKTGLAGKYDFHLEYSGGGGRIGEALAPALSDASDPSGGLSIIDAMEKQLGLKLTKGTAPFDVIVIDHAEKNPDRELRFARRPSLHAMKHPGETERDHRRRN